MTKSTKRILFDSHAILKWTQKESGYKKVKSFIVACRNKSVTGYMSQINLGEVYYMTIRGVGMDRAREFLQNFLRLSIHIVLPDGDLIWRASEIKAENPISYADCFAVATAMEVKATILTGDPEFKKAEKLVTVEWV